MHNNTYQKVYVWKTQYYGETSVNSRKKLVERLKVTLLAYNLSPNKFGYVTRISTPLLL